MNKTKKARQLRTGDMIWLKTFFRDGWQWVTVTAVEKYNAIDTEITFKPDYGNDDFIDSILVANNRSFKVKGVK